MAFLGDDYGGMRRTGTIGVTGTTSPMTEWHRREPHQGDLDVVILLGFTTTTTTVEDVTDGTNEYDSLFGIGWASSLDGAFLILLLLGFWLEALTGEARRTNNFQQAANSSFKVSPLVAVPPLSVARDGACVRAGREKATDLQTCACTTSTLPFEVTGSGPLPYVVRERMGIR